MRSRERKRESDREREREMGGIMKSAEERKGEG
jgi:hypothetical protein